MTQSALARQPSRASGDLTTPAGTRIPSSDLHARRIAREAGLWRAFAGDHTRMLPPTLDAKALDACAFSVLHGASSFAVPSKLVGTSRHQPLLRSLSEPPAATWLALDLDARGDRDGGNLLHDLRRGVQVNEALVNAHLELVPGVWRKGG